MNGLPNVTTHNSLRWIYRIYIKTDWTKKFPPQEGLEQLILIGSKWELSLLRSIYRTKENKKKSGHIAENLE